MEAREERRHVGVQTLLVGLCGVEIGAVEVEMVEESFSLLESCRTDRALELLDWGREKVGGRISGWVVEPGHHVGQPGWGHRQEARVGEVEVEAKVCLLELLGGRGRRLVLLAVAGVEEIKESRTVRCELLLLLLLLLFPGLGSAPCPGPSDTLQHLAFPGGLFTCRIRSLENLIN